MPTEAEVLDALRPVEDPEINQSIVDLDMVRTIKLTGEEGEIEPGLRCDPISLRLGATREPTRPTR